MKMFRLHTTQHKENECGVACINTILKKNKYFVNYSELNELLNPSKEGTSVKQISNFFKGLNVKTTFFKPNNDTNNKITNLKKSQFPCMALLKNNENFHYIIIHKMANNKYIYSDPAEKMFTKTKSSDFINNAILFICFDFSNFNIKSNDLPLSNQNKNIFISEILSEKQSIIKISIINILISILSVYSSMKLGIFIDSLSKKNQLNFNVYIAVVLIIFLLCITVEGISMYVSNKLLIKAVKNLEGKICVKILKNLMQQKYREIKKSNVGDVTSRLENCIDLLISLIKTILTSISDCMLIVFAVIWMFYTDVRLTIIIIISLLINILIIKISLHDMYVKNYNTMEKYSVYNGKLVEVVSSFENIKVTCSEDFHFDRIKNNFLKFVDNAKDTENFFNSITSYRQFASSFTDLIIISLGTLFVAYGEISIGELTTYIILSSLLHAVSNRCIDFFIQLESFFVGYERMTQVINLNSSSNKNMGNQLINTIKTITFRKFEIYHDKNIVSNSNFEFNKNNIVLKGDSGSGKTSFAKILALLENNYNGEILINDKDIKSCDVNSLKSKIVYVSNDSPVYTASILDNLCIGKVVLRKKLEKICRDFEIFDFIKGDSKEFDQLLFANNANLSTGQRQKLSLVRAILLEPAVLILDEALSNIDGNSKYKIIDNLQKYECMKIFITHEKLNIPNCDVFQFKDQRISKL